MVNKLDLKKLNLIFICSIIFALVVFKSSFSDHYLDTECKVGFRIGYLSIDELHTLPSKFSPTVSTYSPRSYRITKIKEDFIYLESPYVKGWVHKSNYGLKQKCEEEHEKNNSKKIYENSKILVNYDHKDLWSINSNYKNSIFKYELETDSFLKNDENNFYRNSIDEVYLLVTDPSFDKSLNFFLLGRAIISQKRSITQQEINTVFTQMKDEISINKNYSSNTTSFVERGFKVNYRRIELEFGHLSKILERSDLNLDDKQHCIVVSVNDTPRYNLNKIGKFHLMFLSCFDNYMERLEIKNFIKSIYFKNFLFPDHYYIFNNKKTSTEEPDILKVQKNQSITEPNLPNVEPKKNDDYKVSYVNTDKLHVRALPSSSSNSLSILDENEKLEILNYNDSSTWAYIKVLKNDLNGWVSTLYLSDQPTDKTNIYITQDKNEDVYIYCQVTNNYIIKLTRTTCPAGYSQTSELAYINFKNSDSGKLFSNDTEEENKNTKIVNNDETNTENKKQIELDIVEKSDDFSPPVIECQNNISTSDQFVNVNCTIEDENDLFAITIDKEKITPSNNISHKVQVLVGSSEIQVEAIDVYGNKSSYVIAVKREFNLDIDKNEYYEKLFPNALNVAFNNNRIAIVVGIKEYKDIPDTKYADKDALTFLDYASNSLGIRPNNIWYRIDNNASYLDMSEINNWLAKKVNKKTEVFVYYSGHGANNNGEALLLPSDFRSSLIEKSSFKKNQFINDILNYGPSHVYAFFDACFSGLGREGETLIAGLRNISIAEEEIIDNVTIFNSASGFEFSSDYEDVGHGLFSYYLMKGLEGKADINKDQQISTSELYTYIEDNVSSTALSIGFAQNPSLLSLQDKIILKW